jgi:hypothetical protein
MMTQTRFPNLVPSHQIIPAVDEREPVIWVRELRVLKDLQPGEEFIARRLQLRRGLNVVWAHPVPSGGDDALFENVLQGHTAGKTTFCRILRYALGEDQFGDEATREAIRHSEELSKGWVVAEVHVEKIPWVVARPFQIGPHPFSIKGATINDLFEKNLLHEDFDLYRRALDAAGTRNLPVKKLPASGLALDWQDLLAWLSRDQECRLSHLLEWRHSASDSGSAKHDRDARELLVRSVLNIVSEQENKELAENERLLANKEKARKQSPLLRHQARSDRLFLEEKFGAPLPEFDDGLFSEAVLVPLNSLATQIKNHRASLPSSEDMKSAQKAFADAVGAESRAEQELKNAREKLRSEEAVLKAAQENKSGETHKELFNQLPPTSEYCNVPIREAINGGCELAKLRCLNFSEEKAKLNFELEVQRQDQIVTAHRRVVEQKVQDHKQAENAAANLRNMWDSAQKIRMAGIEHAIGEEQRIKFLRDLAARASRAWKEAAECDDSLPKIEADIRECQARQEVIRQQHQTALGNFSLLFDYVMRALLGEEISGSVDLSGRNVALEIEYHGQRRSTAINTLKFTVFDVAALVGGIEGHNFHPRFLLHDCPREADMDAAIYRKLFVFALELERSFGSDREPNFQYIITSTETPPASVRQLPWLIEELDASHPETRFLGVDL